VARYKIFPPIGFARVGQDDDFFLGPEIPGQGAIEPATGKPVARFKSANKKRIRKQAARFHLFESNDGANWVPANLPAGATLEWSVKLENKKSAIVRPDSPPQAHQRPVLDPASASMHIKAPEGTISGANAVGPLLQGTFATTGSGGDPFNATVVLGQLRTDAQGRLLVLGGNGASGAPPRTPIGDSFYKNPKWHDDVADGPVKAKIRLTPSSNPIDAEGGAWVVVGPPDYAPGVGGIVTLYDVIREVGNLPAPASPPSFDLDIAPILQRARRHRWVHESPNWSSPDFDNPNLRSKSSAQAALRAAVRLLVLEAENILSGHIDGDPPFKLRKHQTNALDAWASGNFDDAPATFGTSPTAKGLTRAALEGAVGQGFCPGIEAGIIVLDPTLYLSPFDYRINHASVAPGDLTALMAQPWQADFLDCNTVWWPSQRPDIAPQSADLDESPPWVRGAGKHKLLVERFQRLGFIVQQGASEVFIEAERDPTLPQTPA
jgi:hypothetical protein